MSYEITSRKQLEAMALPLRTEIVESLADLGVLSIAELARVTGRRRTLLHYHVARLVEVGLVEEAGHRGEGRCREALYRSPGSPLYVIYDRDDATNVELIVGYARNILSRAQREIARALRGRKVRTDGPRRDAYATQQTCWLDRKQLAAANEHIEALEQICRRSVGRPGAKLHLLTLAFSPLVGRDDKDSGRS